MVSSKVILEIFLLYFVEQIFCFNKTVLSEKYVNVERKMTTECEKSDI